MSVNGDDWGPSQPPYELVTKDGRDLSVVIKEFGADLSDGGGVTHLVHVREPENQDEIDKYGADAVKLGTRWFRPIPD